ncbi:hypothetical protein B9Z55_023289 [Caenorhabditis nigoni]|uniref:Domain of unknown function DB domain-containing protein n=1 Tax=Caenorhabditis nigoni TaxID=1611254 RepID=A0A2G5SNX7_9PELO|nr:hypothetical protein B9Z55_023289 [Caenorhabditis nigoni]
MRCSLLLIFIFAIPIHSWSCGEGKITEGLAWLIAAPSDTKSVNKCCEFHDKNYDNFCAGIGSISLQTADFLFNRCLDNINSRWVRYVVKPLYSAAINVNSWWKKATRNPC